MLCPSCEGSLLQFSESGMAARCTPCARIFGPSELLAEMQRTLDLKRARLVAWRESQQ